MAYVLAFCTVILICMGQILFKKSAMLLSTLKTPFHLALEPMFIGAICLYGFTTILWIFALQHLSLSRGYMIMSLSYIIIPILSFYFFDEPISIRLVVGAILIISGVLIALKG
ncbi:MAG: EamA family transporter [Alphaproteobacteria bacterium]